MNKSLQSSPRKPSPAKATPHSELNKMLMAAARKGAELALLEMRQPHSYQLRAIADQCNKIHLPDGESDLLKESAVADLLSISTKTIHRWVKLGKFPNPIAISARGKRWRSSEVKQWIDGQDKPVS